MQRELRVSIMRILHTEGGPMMSDRAGTAFLTAILLVGTFAIASAQETAAPGAGKLEVGGFPGGGLWLAGGDGNTEVSFNNYDFGGDATWYLNSKAAIEGESAFGLGLSQNVHYRNQTVYRVQMPHTLGVNGNIVVFPAGSAEHVAGYVTGGAGTLTLFSRTAASRIFGLTQNESFFTTNVGGGMKIFRRGDYRNWGFRIDYRLVFVNSKSDALAFFAQSKRRMGHRFYIGMLYTMKR
jgi:hypothetical protein